VEHAVYPPEPGKEAPLLRESSAIGDYDDAMEKPGSSFLWLGERHHLDRDEISQLVNYLQHWLVVGRLPKPVADGPEAAQAAKEET
jgi:hypothetical protein